MPTMLVVDDDPAWRSLYRMEFEGRFNVLEAVDGLHALSLLEQVTPDIILLDCRMPRLDGIGVLRSLETKAIGSPVVLCSSMPETAESGVPARVGVRLAAKTPDLRFVRDAVMAALCGGAEGASGAPHGRRLSPAR
jgi:two-component system response regulator